MKIFRFTRRIAGFTLVETMLAVSILSLAALMSSRTLLDATKSIHQLRYQKKTATLAEMVFQQYAAYSVQNYHVLAAYNVTKQEPKVFFNRPDNFGYDGLLITTLAAYSANGSSCTVHLSISWMAGGSPKTTSYVKTYVESGQLASGGAVQVWMKTPCPTGTDQASIIANCPGQAGFTLTTTSNSGGTSVVGITDVNGQALLNNVLLGNNVLIHATPPGISEYHDATAAPSYYDYISYWNIPSSVTKTLSVTSGNLNTLVITDFQPTGQVVGQLVNDDTSMSNPPVANMSVILSAGNQVGDQGTFWACSTPALAAANGGLACIVQTDANGNFIFNNVIPAALSVQGLGRPGSFPTLQPGVPEFQWGYTSSGSQAVSATDWTTTMTHNPINNGPIVHVTVHIQRMGSAAVHVYNKNTNQPITGLTMHAKFPVTPWNLNPEVITVPSPDSGVENFYNIFSDNNVSLYTDAARSAQSVDNGFFAQQTVNCGSNCIGQVVDINMPMSPFYLLTGNFVDDNPSSVVNGMTLYEYQPTGSLMSQIGATGNFSIPMIPLPRANPSDAFGYGFLIYNYSAQIPADVQGRTIDQATGGPAPHVMLSVYNSQELVDYAIIKSDGNGYFSYQSTFSYVGNVSATITCDDTALTCIACPSGSASCSGTPVPVHIDSRLSNTVAFGRASVMHGYFFDNMGAVLQTTAATPYITVPCTLVDVAVNGTVRNGQGHPVGGISVFAAGNNTPITPASQSNGTYGGYVPVQGRSSTSGGYITNIVTTNQTGSDGQSYAASSSGQNQVPLNFDQDTTSITQDISLNASTGTGGSGL